MVTGVEVAGVKVVVVVTGVEVAGVEVVVTGIEVVVTGYVVAGVVVVVAVVAMVARGVGVGIGVGGQVGEQPVEDRWVERTLVRDVDRRRYVGPDAVGFAAGSVARPVRRRSGVMVLAATVCRLASACGPVDQGEAVLDELVENVTVEPVAVRFVRCGLSRSERGNEGSNSEVQLILRYSSDRAWHSGRCDDMAAATTARRVRPLRYRQKVRRSRTGRLSPTDRGSVVISVEIHHNRSDQGYCSYRYNIHCPSVLKVWRAVCRYVNCELSVRLPSPLLTTGCPATSVAEASEVVGQRLPIKLSSS